jgi:hypothetical protein
MTARSTSKRTADTLNRSQLGKADVNRLDRAFALIDLEVSEEGCSTTWHLKVGEKIGVYGDERGMIDA